jgi:hypothetical protein
VPAARGIMLRFMALAAFQPPPDAGFGDDVIAVLAGGCPRCLLLALMPSRSCHAYAHAREGHRDRDTQSHKATSPPPGVPCVSCTRFRAPPVWPPRVAIRLCACHSAVPPAAAADNALVRLLLQILPLHPTPYSLHATRYTLHPTRYTLHYTYTLNRAGADDGLIRLLLYHVPRKQWAVAAELRFHHAAILSLHLSVLQSQGRTSHMLLSGAPPFLPPSLPPSPSLSPSLPPCFPREGGRS